MAAKIFFAAKDRSMLLLAVPLVTLLSVGLTLVAPIGAVVFTGPSFGAASLWGIRASTAY